MMKLLYSKNYVERDLYVIEYKNKYLMVYASSGLNPGRKGRILPFAMLANPPRATLSDEVPGYIYKKVYFDSKWVNHRKDPRSLGEFIPAFLLKLEDFVSNHTPVEEDYSYIESYADMRPLVESISIELKSAIKGLKPFDWALLSEDDI
jgi:hypothetical protein